MLKVTLESANGQSYLLTGTDAESPVLAPEDALRELRGVSQRTDLAVPGRAGVLPGMTRYGSIQTEIEFYLRAEDGEQMEQVYKLFRQGWSKTSPSQIVVEADRPGGPYTLDVVLDRDLPGVSVDARRRTQVNLPVSVFNRDGLFRSTLQSGTGTVTVTNGGDTVVYPKIRYSGSGGVVTGPSGASFTLPGASTLTTVDLDARALRLDGAFSEGVMPGATGTWQLPAGATLQWHTLVADPWA